MDGPLLPPAPSPAPRSSRLSPHAQPWWPSVALVGCLVLGGAPFWAGLSDVPAQLSAAVGVIAQRVGVEGVVKVPQATARVPEWAPGGTPRFYPPGSFRKKEASPPAQRAKGASTLRQPTAAAPPPAAPPTPPSSTRVPWGQKSAQLRKAMVPWLPRLPWQMVQGDVLQPTFDVTPGAFHRTLSVYGRAIAAAAPTLPPADACDLVTLLVRLGMELDLRSEHLEVVQHAVTQLAKGVLRSNEALPGVFVVETMTLLAGSGDTYRAAVDLLAQRLFVSLAVEELGADRALQVVWALARCRVQDPPLLAALARHLAQPDIAETLTPAELTELAEAYAALVAPEAALLTLLRQRAAAPTGLADFTAPQLLAVARACAALRFRDGGLRAALAREAGRPTKQQQLDAASWTELENLLGGPATVETHPASSSAL